MMTDVPLGWMVRLKSGGQTMTVTKVESERVDCHWFVGNELRQGKFNREDLADALPAHWKSSNTSALWARRKGDRRWRSGLS
jgi:uncharacterized protein YodC (DUF2158 family)